MHDELDSDAIIATNRLFRRLANGRIRSCSLCQALLALLFRLFPRTKHLPTYASR